MSKMTVEPTPAQQAIAKARAVAERIEQAELRGTILAGLDTMLFSQVDARIVEQAKLLVTHWQRMPEHITGATAIAQLREVLAGGYAPGAPRPVRK